MGAFVDRLLARVRALFRGASLDSELDGELDHHLNALTDDNVKSGMAPDEALRRARIALGGAVAAREAHREARGIPWLENWLRDLRHAFRLFRREIGFTAIALTILAIGVGLNTTVFSLVNTVLLRPIPFAQSDRLVWITNGDPHGDLSGITSQIDTWEGLQETSQTLDRIEGYSPFSVRQTYRLMGTGEPETIVSVDVTHGLFPLLGMKPLLGRLFLPEDSLKNAPGRIVLTHELWVRRFRADPGIVGKTVQVSGTPVEVIGVLPASDPFASVFFPAVQIDCYDAVANDKFRDDGNVLFLIGHMRPGVTAAQVERELPVAIARIKKKYPNRDQNIAAAAEPLRDWVSGSLRKPLLFLWVSAGFVLAIAGFNLGGLLLARGGSRRQEMSLRVALGASRGRIMSQLLTECVGLVAAGSFLGGLIAWGFILFLAHRSSMQIPLLQYLKLDGEALGYTVVLCLVTAIVCGAAPAWKFSGGEATRNPLNESARGSSGGPGQSRTRNVLVIAEVALAFSLAVSAALLVMSMRNLLRVNLGFDPNNLVAVRIDTVVQGSENEYIASLLEHVRAIPGVEQAAVTDCIPVERDRSWGVYPAVPGSPEEKHWQGAHIRVVSPGLIRTMGTTLIAGRDFERSDEKGPGVTIINQSLAKRIWPTEDPIGRQLYASWAKGAQTVIGVVADVRGSGPELPAGNEFYLTQGQMQSTSSWDLMVRTKLPVPALITGIRDSLMPLDSSVPLTKVRTMQTLVDRVLSSRRMLVSLIVGFAVVAAGLALVGLYGVISYMVSQQTREIGIRMALGAASGDVQRQIVGKTLSLALFGLGLGLIITFLGAQSLRTMLYGVSPRDAMTHVIAALALLGCAVGAGYLPARRASRIDPAVALRAE